MAQYIEGLVEALGAAGARPVLRHGGRDVAGAALLADVHRYGRALEGSGSAAVTSCPAGAQQPGGAGRALRREPHRGGRGVPVGTAGPGAPRPDDRQFAPRLVVVFPETAELLPSVSGPVAAIGPVPGVSTRLDALAAAEPDTPLPSRAHPDDLAVVISSGGTTGVPKGSMRTFASYTAAVACPPAPPCSTHSAVAHASRSTAPPGHGSTAPSATPRSGSVITTA
jgi:fatty-acyl-CoA synthase